MNDFTRTYDWVDTQQTVMEDGQKVTITVPVWTATDVYLTDEEQAIVDAQRAADKRARILPDLAAHRYAVKVGGTSVSLTVNGAPTMVPFLTDSDSQIAIMGAMMIASSNPSYTVNWKTPDGFVQLDASQVVAAAMGVAAFIQKCFDVEKSLIPDAANYGDSASIIAAFDAEMAQ